MTRTKKSKPGGNKKQAAKKTASTTPDIEELYEFTDDKAKQVKIKLVEWYDKNKRTMPWRHSTVPDTEAELHQRAYEVWVSEIMLQQTRVETVIEYYKKWMARFPTVKSLADASIEDVNTQWAGLGYYRRAKFLHEAAKKLVEQNPNSDIIKLPDTAAGLEKLPGVGKYTAGAISSIVFNRVEPLVDGNVLRVLSRLQACNLDIADQKHHKTVFWPQAAQLVKQPLDDSGDLRPGDFNQSLMELGALVCTPKSAKCTTCPVKELCNVYKMKKDGEIETVEQFPVKKKKNAPQDETVITCIFNYQEKYLCVKRPETGLLAGLWEFPSVMIEDPKLKQKEMIEKINETTLKSEQVKKALKLGDNKTEFAFTYCGQVTHVFTHIKQLLHVFCVTVLEIDPTMVDDKTKWMSSADMNQAGVPTLVKKVLKQYQNHNKLVGKGVQKKLPQKRKREESEDEAEDTDEE